MNSMFDVRDRVVLLTGATGYLGRILARGFAVAGAVVLVNSRSSSRAQALANELVAAGGQALPLAFDVTDSAARLAALTWVQQQFGRLDILINNAMAVFEPRDFARSYQVGVVAANDLIEDSLGLLGTSAARNPGGASVINMASMYGVVSPDPSLYGRNFPPNPVEYGAAKAGLLQLTRHLGVALGPRRIRVNALSPGPFPSAEVQEQSPDFIQRLGQRNPLGRIGRPEELVGPALFLASDAASYVTGANLPVDGGWTSW